MNPGKYHSCCYVHIFDKNYSFLFSFLEVLNPPVTEKSTFESNGYFLSTVLCGTDS